MTQIAIDPSGKTLPARSRHDDGYIYHVTGRTQAGDEVFSEYGKRWHPVIVVGFWMPENLRYRRPKQ